MQNLSKRNRLLERQKETKKAALQIFFQQFKMDFFEDKLKLDFSKAICKDLKDLNLVQGSKNCLNAVKIQFLSRPFPKIGDADKLR